MKAIRVMVARESILHEAAREIAYLAEAESYRNDVAHKIPETADSPLLTELWDRACREADLLLTRYRVPIAPCPPDETYIALLCMPPGFDETLASVLAAHLRNYFKAAVKVAFLRTAWGNDCPPACTEEEDRCRSRLLEVLNRRNRPVRKGMTFG